MGQLGSEDWLLWDSLDRQTKWTGCCGIAGLRGLVVVGQPGLEDWLWWDSLDSQAQRTGCCGTVRLRGLVLICTEDGEMKKLNPD